MLRYEISVPLKYNDGNDIEPQKFYETKEELVSRFGGLSIIPRSSGLWRSQGRTYADEIFVFRVDTEHDEMIFFQSYKEILKERFKQLDIHIVTHNISIV